MRKLIYTGVLFLLICFTKDMNAQPPNPGGGGNETPNCFPPPCVPIDGGLSWLLLAGVAYGGKKVFELNKDNLDSET